MTSTDTTTTATDPECVCQYCKAPVAWTRKNGYGEFTHVATGTTACPK